MLLRRAWEKMRLASIWRGKLDPKELTGFVVGLSDQIVLLHLLSDLIILDGWSAIRLEDITELTVPPKRDDFYQKALQMRHERPKEPAGLFVDDFRTLIDSAGRRFPLITIHRELIDRDCCYIGRVRKVNSRTVALQEIDPGAKLDEQPTDYRVADITKVDFGGRYEEALAMVANLKA